MLKKHIRTVFGFGLAGLLAGVADLIVFNAALLVSGQIETSNLFGALSGVVVNFIVNRAVFDTHREKGIWRPVLRFLFVAGLSALYLIVVFQVSAVVFELEGGLELNLLRVAIIGSGAIIRFFITKNWVFK